MAIAPLAILRSRHLLLILFFVVKVKLRLVGELKIYEKGFPMTTINVSSNVQVSGGPQIGFVLPITVGSYEKIEFTLTKDNTTQTVNLGKNPSLLLIKSDSVNVPTVSYSVGSVKDVKLDAPHLYLGKGVTSILGKDTDLKLVFTFQPGKPETVSVEILIGGDVPT